MRKNLFICLIAMLMTFTSCGESKLQKMVESTNSECPISIGELGEATEISLEDGYVVFTYAINEAYADIDALSENPETIKSGVVSALVQSSKDMFKLMKEEHAGLKLKYIGKTSKKTFTMELSPEECVSILDSVEKGTSDSPLDILKNQIATTNVQCPMTVAEGMVIHELTLEGDYVVYYVNVDESMYDMEEMEANKYQSKIDIMSSLTDGSDPSVSHFIKSCTNADKGVAYKYIGSSSGKSFQINISKEELL